ncbi:UNVERIFIED_CONTAM: hypothetical protein FKN15_061639 [Acipenser sinensis]
MESDNGSDEDFKVGLEDFDTSDSDADLSLSDDDEEDVEPRTAGDWVFVTGPYHDASPPSFDFAPVYTDVHPAVELESLHSPLECFLAFVPEKLITYLCDCANKRACSYFTGKPAANGKVFGLKWQDVEPKVIYIIFALVFLMGINKLPRMSAYWSQHLLMQGPPSPVFCKEVMSRPPSYKTGAVSFHAQRDINEFS